VNDRSSFDKMLRWTEDNLAGGDLTARLPAWKWGKSADGAWTTLDTNSAGDADLWLAYDCLEGGRLWKDDRLQKLGQVLADHIAHTEIALIPNVGSALLPAPQGFHPGGSAYLLNPSYTPPQLLARLREEQPSGPWADMQSGLPLLLAAGSPAGFAPDWVLAGTTIKPSIAPDALAQGKTDSVAVGSYDAIRVYLWLGMADSHTEGVRGSLDAVQGMAQYLTAHVLPPLQVSSDGTVLKADSPVGFSAAVVPYLQATGHKRESTAQMNRVDAGFDSSTGLYGHTPEYYDQNLALFAKGWSEQRFKFDRNGRLQVRWKS
jgi:endo-1,4-beta-D-glucanase Y